MVSMHRIRTGAGPRLVIAGALLALLAMAGMNRTSTAVTARTWQSEGTAVHYRAGWNLVAAPTATELTGAVGTQYAFGADGTGYTPVRTGEIVGGRAVWAYFAGDTTLQLGPTAAAFTRLLAQPNQWVLAGNPSSTQTLPINGADAALAYDATNGYQPISELAPGEGAWVMRFTPGDITIGTAPALPAASEIRGVQQALSGDAADPSGFGMMPGLASRLIEGRSYDAVQELMDDVRAAFVDGLRVEQTATIPALTEKQRSAMELVRVDLAKAKEAAAAGDSLTEAAAVADAKKQAQAAQDNAAQEARSNSSTLAYAGFKGLPHTPQSLARYGALCIGTTPALSLALIPSSDFLALVVATLQGQPAPAPSTPTPTPAPVSPSPQAPAYTLPTMIGQSPPNCTSARVTLSNTTGSSQQPKSILVTYSGLDPNSPVVVYAYAPSSVSPPASANGVSDGAGNGRVTLSLPAQTVRVQFSIVAQSSTKCGYADFTAV